MKRNTAALFSLFAVVLFAACGSRDANRANGNRNAANANATTNVNTGNSSANANLSANANSSNSNIAIVDTPANEGDGLLQIEDAWNAAYVRRDEGWFQQNLADDYTEIGDSGKTINDKAGAIAAMLADKSTGITTELSDTKVRIEGNSAVVTGVNHVKLKDENGHLQDYRHRYTDTYIKRDGKWLIWANESTRMP